MQNDLDFFGRAALSGGTRTLCTLAQPGHTSGYLWIDVWLSGSQVGIEFMAKERMRDCVLSCSLQSCI